MKIRYGLLGGAVGVLTGMGIALTAIGVANIDKERRIEEKRNELLDSIYASSPNESRLSRPYSSALPSSSYQN